MILDPKSLLILKEVHPELALRFIHAAQDIYSNIGRQIKVVDGYRSFKEQSQIWRKGRILKDGKWILIDPKSRVTDARPGLSLHNYGLSIDGAFAGGDPYLKNLPKEESIILWDKYGKYVELNGMIWGGRFKIVDKPHCEMSFGLSIHQIQIIFQDKGIRGVWDKCIIYNK
jgi:D-alanyl-D-alanine carboxypeptidase